MKKTLIAAVAASLVCSAAYADVTLSGSTGYRLQTTTVGTAPQTSADRYKLELTASAKVNDSITAVAGLRTGPVNSAYTDFGNNAVTDNIGINLAYVEYKPMADVKVTVGKMNQPWADSSSYLFDRDVKPTGFAVAYNSNTGLFANASQLALVEGNTAVDTRVQNVQVGYGKTVYGVALKGAVGRYAYANTGAQKYTVNQAFLTASYKVAGYPVTAFVETLGNAYATNPNDNAKAVGVKVADAAGKYDVGYAYQSNESASQYGLWNDSDFAGGQGNYKGTAYSASYNVSKGFKVAAKYFSATRGTPRANWSRGQFDLTYTF